MTRKTWWISVAAIAAIGVVAFIIPGLVNMNPHFFYYGGITLAVAAGMTVWLLVRGRSKSGR